MSVKEYVLTASVVPARIRNIAQPPNQLFIRGEDVNVLLNLPCVTIVGSRKVSAYGKAVTIALAEGLARAGVVIISGLAFGVDSIAHQAALEAGGKCIAVLPTSLQHIYPASHRSLAQRIAEQGGALVSEYEAAEPTYPSHFIARNRLVSAMGDAVLITEAAERSGTLSTARFALEQGKDVLVVPGNITSPTSAGTNNLLKAGATPITCVEDILHVLGLSAATRRGKHAPKGATAAEQALLDLLYGGISDGVELLTRSQQSISLFNQTLTMLEIRGQIRPLGNNHWALS